MKNWDLTRAKILAAPLPEDTKTYTAIPHSLFLEELSEKLTDRGYRIEREAYLGASNYQLITGHWTLNSNVWESEYSTLPIKPAVYFTNSYDKSRRAMLRVGATVLVCKNGMIGTSNVGAYSRKHKGNALNDFRKHTQLVLDNLDVEFENLRKNVQEMQDIKLSKKVRATLVGDMIINEQMITATQIGILNKEINFSKDFNDGSLWSFYNNCTEAFKDTHPTNFNNQHLKLHAYISDKFQLTGARGLYKDFLEQEEIQDVTAEVV